MAVRLCVVAGPNADAIAAVCQPIAMQDPVGRAFLRPGGGGYPLAAVNAAIAGIANPGAVLFKNDGSVSEVLDANDAQNALIVIDAFVRAAQ